MLHCATDDSMTPIGNPIIPQEDDAPPNILDELVLRRRLIALDNRVRDFTEFIERLVGDGA
jgi:hypothetical protein